MCHSVSLGYMLVVLKIIQFWWLCVSFCSSRLPVGSPEDHTRYSRQGLVASCNVLSLWIGDGSTVMQDVLLG